jgi:hypothetical protein
MAKAVRNARKLELGPAEIFIISLPRAHAIIGEPTPYGDNEAIYVESVRPGAGFDVNGNALDYNGDLVTITIQNDVLVVNGHTDLTVAVSGTAITVGVKLGTTIADDVIAALTNDSEASFLVTAARYAGSTGQGIIEAGPYTVQLAGGDGAAITRDVGFLGDEVAYQVVTEAANLTGAQTGNVPQDKVVIGGTVKVVIPFKEISLDNFRAGVPSARVVQNSDGSKRRVDFTVAVGQSMRQTLSVKMQIIKIKGGFLSSLPADQIIIPEISPAEGEVNFPFAPTTQRHIMTNWYAWPNGNTGRWAFTGDEFP